MSELSKVDPSIISDWPRDALAKLYVTCCLMEFKRVGILHGGNFEAGPNLLPFWKYLRSTGFEPIRHEIDEALEQVPLATEPRDRRNLAKMIEHFDDAMGHVQDLVAEECARQAYAKGVRAATKRWLRKVAKLFQWKGRG